jgi:uncharacterized protein
MNNSTQADDDPPVTIDITRKVRPGCEAEFEEILVGIIADAMKFEGHLGTNVFRPSNPNNPEYRVIFKFDRMSNLHRWENSKVRCQWYTRAESLTLGSPEIQKLTGLEAWFTLPNQRTIVPPPRYKIAFLTWLGIFPLVTAMFILFGSFLNPMPLVLRTLILTAVLVPLMAYLVTPLLTKLFDRWLYPSNESLSKEKFRLTRQLNRSKRKRHL